MHNGREGSHLKAGERRAYGNRERKRVVVQAVEFTPDMGSECVTIFEDISLQEAKDVKMRSLQCILTGDLCKRTQSHKGKTVGVDNMEKACYLEERVSEKKNHTCQQLDLELLTLVKKLLLFKVPSLWRFAMGTITM